ncbi:Hint domain-containing protein [Phaeobacter italicus]|jgi:hypothetical protein|uniref:Hint domain-containing protein n=1 Tax=Phaeobacter italicus TaxID=481446 RepID=UPI002FD89443
MTTINIDRQDGTPRETAHTVREDTSSRGVDLDGAQVTVVYTDGTSETLTWQALDPYTTGGATGENIDMFFGFSWHELSATKPIASLEIDLAPANSVFDTTFAMDDDPAGGSTPTSKNGFPFKLAPEYEDLAGTITATYSDIVNFEGSAAVGDLYTTMTIDFTGLEGGGFVGDLQWNSDIDTLTGPYKDSTPPPCFVAGTLIATDLGLLPVETLEIGALVATRDHGLQPLRWIGRSRRRALGRDAPVVFAANALGRHQRIALSPNHRVLIASERAELLFGQSEVLVKAKDLVNDGTIRVQADGAEITYVHLLFDRHEILTGNGLDSESYHPGLQTRASFDAATEDEVLRLFGDQGDYGPTARMVLKSHEIGLVLPA